MTRSTAPGRCCRAIERLLEDPLAESLLRGDVKPGDKIEAVETDGTETLTFLHIKDKKPAAQSAAQENAAETQGGINAFRLFNQAPAC